MKTWLKTVLFSSFVIATTACVAPKAQTTQTSEVSSTSPTEKVVAKKEQKASSQSVKAFTKNVKVKNVYTDNELILLLKKHGYYNTELIDDGLIRVVIYDEKFVLYNGTKDKEIITLAYYLENDINITLDVLNKWNNDLIMKASLDNDNAIRFNYTLDTESGISEEQILKLLKMGEFSVNYFGTFLEEQRKKK